MKRALVILAVVTGLALVRYGALFLAYGGFARGVVEDGDRVAVVSTAGDLIDVDTCRYQLHVPADIDMPETPAFDTTIVRTAGCMHHLLRFPSWGTETTYKITGNVLERSVGFGIDEKEKQWLEISDLPVGDYSVHVLACGNGGFFKLRIR